MLGGTAAAIVLAVAAACGGGGTTSSTAPIDTGAAVVPTAAPPTSAGTVAGKCTPGAADGAKQVNITGAHDVDQTSFTIAAGSTVSWNNQSNTNHQIFFDGGPDCGILVIGKSVSITFQTPGTYSWVDHIYPTYISGSITVQ